MTQFEEMRDRNKQFALRIIRLFRALPRTGEAQIIGRQLLRSGTAVAANYRAACRARSRAEFVSRIAVVLEEADESGFWLELMVESGIIPAKRLEPLRSEAMQLVRIFSASLRTAKQKETGAGPARRSINPSIPHSLNSREEQHV